MSRTPPDSLIPATTTVTATARLARRLAWQFTGARLDAGQGAWESPDILPWQAWVTRLYEARRWQAGTTDIVLRPAQRRVLWQQIIDASEQRERLLQPAAVAQRAIDAWETVHAFGVPIFPDSLFLNEDARAFRAWAAAFQRRCAEGGWVDEAMLPAMLAREVGESPPVAPSPVSLAGFDELTPAARDLVAALRRAGIDVTQRATPPAQGRAIRASFQDQRAELAAAARWARHCLEHDPGCSIGIVVPGLARVRGRARDIFADVLTPGALPAVPDGRQGVFSIAAGEALADQPLVSHALLLLALTMGALPARDVGTLLRSPFLHGAQREAAARALLDAALRRRRDPEPGLGAILGEGARAGAGAPAVLLQGLEVLQRQVRALPARQRAPEWARACSAMLKVAGWPGDRALTSIEYQVLSAWRELLGELAALDVVAGPMNFPAALRHLRRLAADRPFQPQTPEAPVQLLDLAGAADMGFDRLWVTGLHEDAWPPTAQPSPFIPLPLQRELAMPRASATQELARAMSVTESLLGCCPDVVVSWPRQDGETLLRPSPLIRAVAEGTPPGVEGRAWIALAYGARRAETFVDDRGPALAAGANVRGGATLFKNQAACPFRAFAKHRLQAEALDEADVGLDALDRGNLVHRVLEKFWISLGSRDALAALDDVERVERVQQAVNEVVSAEAARRPHLFTTRFAAVERARLARLIGEWLEVELARDPFTVVSCEARRPFRLGGINGELRVDRIDALPDGREVILDYKTGKVPSKPWEGARPEEPQLPLYAVTAAAVPGAVAFARVVRGESGFRGTAAEAGLLPGVKAAPEWERTLAAWRDVLLALAGEFESGHAPVDPRDGLVTCRHCDLHGFCRVHELGAAPEPDEEAP